MIIIIDNYDSFTYNLYQYIGELNSDIEVYRNDAISVAEILRKNPSHIVISPGPGFPKDAGISVQLIKELGHHIPILGVCLGHQSIAEAFGGKVINAQELMHGKTSKVSVDTCCQLFSNINETINVGRYHSLIVERESIPSELSIIAETVNGEIMGLKHIKYPAFGVQFHPESILTPDGKQILKNFLEIKYSNM
jgi:anthranilate synthase component II